MPENEKNNFVDDGYIVNHGFEWRSCPKCGRWNCTVKCGQAEDCEEFQLCICFYENFEDFEERS